MNKFVPRHSEGNHSIVVGGPNPPLEGLILTEIEQLNEPEV